MNWTITDILKEKLEKEMKIKLDIECSKTSDYIKLPTRDGSTESIRISNHDALTGRSACALLSFNISDFRVDEWNGMFESNLDWDDGYLEFNAEKPFDTMKEAKEHNIASAMKEIKKVIADNSHLFSYRN